jgi:glycosyltransferase involved in cell wall biosynthesis
MPFRPAGKKGRMMPTPKLAFCLEQTLGHRAHGLNLEAAIARHAPGSAVHRIEYPDHTRLPLPWALRGSAAAGQAAARTRAQVSLFHTSTISLFAPLAALGRRYVVSLDATPLQVDSMGRWYQHDPGNQHAERLKRAWYSRVFRRAAGLVSWSAWAADSLVNDYAVPRDRILIAHPGASAPFFGLERAPWGERKTRILFVGGDFERKGGDLLLKAFGPLSGQAELTLVTDADVPSLPGVRRESGIKPGTDRLLRAYAEADVFVLPTRGDCTPVVLGEAMAAGLPVVTTAVGSNAETVTDGLDGRIVPAGDAAALGEALRALVDDPAARAAMGARARESAGERMDAAANALRIIGLMRDLA